MIDAVIARAFRDEGPAILATLIRQVSDSHLAADAMQDAFAAAVASAFRVGEVAMAQRFVRASRTSAAAGIAYRVPPAHLLPERLSGVLAVVYLVFNEGYAAAEGDRLVRGELCAEAIRLGRLLCRPMPDDAEVLGLTALMLLPDSRRQARVDPEGPYAARDEPDRSLGGPGRLRAGLP